jgi:glycosyltransferase involved in cell wall biosynthesis
MSLLKEIPAIKNKVGWPWSEETDSAIYQEVKYWPKISIVTASYNQGQYIEETIRSVLLQNYPNLEYIIIDGGSTDNTVEIIKKYDKWITYWVSEPDQGQTHAINKGFRKVSGEITNWLNSDDYLYPKAAYEIGKFFLDNPEIHFMHGSGSYVNDEGKVWSARKKFDHMEARQITHFCYDLQPACYYRTEVFKEIGYLNEEMHLQMDTEFFIRIALNFQIKRNLVNICYFREHDQRKSHVGYSKKDFTDFPTEYHRVFGKVINSLSFDEEDKKMLEVSGLLYETDDIFMYKKNISKKTLKDSVILYSLIETDIGFKYGRMNKTRIKNILFLLIKSYGPYVIKFRLYRSLFVKTILFGFNPKVIKTKKLYKAKM